MVIPYFRDANAPDKSFKCQVFIAIIVAFVLHVDFRVSEV